MPNGQLILDAPCPFHIPSAEARLRALAPAAARCAGVGCGTRPPPAGDLAAPASGLGEPRAAGGVEPGVLARWWLRSRRCALHLASPMDWQRARVFTKTWLLFILSSSVLSSDFRFSVTWECRSEKGQRRTLAPCKFHARSKSAQVSSSAGLEVVSLSPAALVSCVLNPESCPLSSPSLFSILLLPWAPGHPTPDPMGHWAVGLWASGPQASGTGTLPTWALGAHFCTCMPPWLHVFALSLKFAKHVFARVCHRGLGGCSKYHIGASSWIPNHSLRLLLAWKWHVFAAQAITTGTQPLSSRFPGGGEGIGNIHILYNNHCDFLFFAPSCAPQCPSAQSKIVHLRSVLLTRFCTCVPAPAQSWLVLAPWAVLGPRSPLAPLENTFLHIGVPCAPLESTFLHVLARSGVRNCTSGAQNGTREQIGDMFFAPVPKSDFGVGS